MISVKRKHDFTTPYSEKAWTREEALKAREWCEKNCPGTLVENSYDEFLFNNKQAALIFKIIWG